MGVHEPHPPPERPIMTNKQHGQVPEALIDLIDAYAETRHRCGGIYNAKTEAARNAVVEALSGVQALSAGPGAIAKLRHLYQNMVNGAVRDTASAKRIAEGLLAPAIEALERATPPAEQQAPATEGYVQPVPDKCDRITWRGRYYHLPLTEQAAPRQRPPAPHCRKVGQRALLNSAMTALKKLLTARSA